MTARSTDLRGSASEKWDPAWSNPVFSLAERDARWAKVRRLMARDKIDLIVCLPGGRAHERGAADARYLTQLGENGDESTVAFPIEGDITAWHSRPGVWPSSNWFADIRSAQRGCGAAVLIDWIREHPLYTTARIAISGLSSSRLIHIRTAEGEVNWQSVEMLKAAFPQAEFVSATTVLGEARWVKSDEEIAFLQIATEIAEVTLQAQRDTARAGVREREVFAAMVHAAANANGSWMPMFGWVSGPQGAPYHRIEMPTLRTLQPGDMLCIEIEGRWAGHIAQIDATSVMSHAEPFTLTSVKVLEEVFETVCQRLKPGVTFGELSDCAELKAMNGRLVSGLGLHGRGTGDDGPLLTARRKLAPDVRTMTLEENCCFAIKPGVSIDDRAEVFRWGDTVAVTKNGGRRLGTRPFELYIL
jgi:Xaa-Pro aminopeptidase